MNDERRDLEPVPPSRAGDPEAPADSEREVGIGDRNRPGPTKAPIQAPIEAPIEAPIDPRQAHASTFSYQPDEPSGRVDGETLLAGRYRLLGKVGEGGMGEVWDAEQREPVRRHVAIKVIKRGMDTKEVVARFEVERQALAMMNHPNVAKVFDAGQTQRGRPFFAMEFVSGDPISAYCDKHRLTTRERIDLVIEVCHGIQHAHQKGLIHRDLKPTNILVTVDAQNRPTPKIIDFGIAKATGQSLTDRTLFTHLGQMIGTPEYMSPEQAEMTGLDVDTRTDVYSLGVILYELLTGALPFDAHGFRDAGLVEIQRRIREDEPPRPSTRVSTLGADTDEVAQRRRTETSALAKHLRGDLDRITMKALDKERTRRYDSPVELAADLKRYLRNEPVLAVSPSTSYRVRKFVRRHRVGVAAAGVVLLALIAGMAGTTAGLVRATRAEAGAVAARDEAIAERDRAEQAREEVSEVVAFLTGLFQGSDPGETLGETVTARELLDRGAARIDAELTDRPLTKARMLETMSGVYKELGLYDIARTQLGEVLAIRRRELGDTHLETARTLNYQSNLSYSEADFETAERTAREALAIYRAVLGDSDHAEIAAALSDIGVALDGQGRTGEAEPLYREALDMARRLPEPDPKQLEVYVRRLAIVLEGKDDPSEAKALYEESYELCREVYGDPSPRLAFAIDNLAIFYHVQGDPVQAEPLYRRSLAMLRKMYGEEHPEVAQTMGNLGEFLFYIKAPSEHGSDVDVEEAAALHQAALQINRKFRPDHPFVADNLGTLAAILHQAGDLVEAERLAREALTILRRKLEEEHPRIFWAKARLGGILVARGRYEEAEGYLREAHEAGAAGENPGDDQKLLENLVTTYRELQRADDHARFQSLLDETSRLAS